MWVFLIIAFSWIAYAQNLSLSGSLYQQNPSGTSPIPANGYRVYLYRHFTGWIGPPITDSSGRYALYLPRFPPPIQVVDMICHATEALLTYVVCLGDSHTPFTLG